MSLLGARGNGNKMACRAFCIIILLIATARLFASPALGASAAAGELQDRIDKQSRQIGTMTGYSLRLQGVLTKAGVTPKPSLKSLSLHQKLDRILPGVHCNEVHFADALAALSREGEITITADWKILENAGIDKVTPVSCDLRHCSVQEALNVILDAAAGTTSKITFIEANGIIEVTTSEDAEKHVATKTYDVAFLFARDMAIEDSQDRIARLLTEIVAPESWLDNGGSAGSIKFNDRQMVVTQTAANLAAVDTLLEQLDARKARAHLQATIDENDRQIAALTIEIHKLVSTCRSLAIPVPLPAAQAMGQVLPNLQLNETPLSACLGRLSAESGQLFTVDWKAVAGAGIDARKPITLSLQNQTLAEAIQSLLDNAGGDNHPLAWRLENDTINVSTKEQVARFTVTRTYDIRNLLTGGNREETVGRMMSVLTSTVDTDTWKDAGGITGSIRELQGYLIITQSPDAQARIKTIIDAWRVRRKITRSNGL